MVITDPGNFACTLVSTIYREFCNVLDGITKGDSFPAVKSKLLSVVPLSLAR